MIIAFDVSSDAREANWIKVVDGYATQRGITGWPMGAGWPPEDASESEVAEELAKVEDATEKEAADKSNEAQQLTGQGTPPAEKKRMVNSLGYCNVWVGSTKERTGDDEPPLSKRVEDDMELLHHDAGIGVIYFPFLANPKVEGLDPLTSDFMSTWNFVYTPDQIDKAVALARANFEEGADQTKRAVKAVYERKKSKRLEKEAQEKEERRFRKMRLGMVGKKLGEGMHADQFT